MPKPSLDTSELEPDLDRALELVLKLLNIPGLSGDEGLVQEFIRAELIAAGAAPESITTDDAHTRSVLGGKVGNLVFKLPGTTKSGRRLLMAHLDTVPICLGTIPVLEGDHIRSGNPQTGLGADDRAGVAVVLTAALEILRRKLPHPPLTFFWPVQEEVGLHGARHATLGLLGKPRLCFNWDGSGPLKLTTGATGAYRIKVDIEGLASHAGVAPEMGVSAATIAGLAIAQLRREGWLGNIQKNGQHGTSNIGVLQGGHATNVVMNQLEIKAECRSHDAKFRREILRAFQESFEQAASDVRNILGVPGKVNFHHRLDYESFRLENSEPCVLAAEAAIRSLGEEPVRAISNGGLDANWMTERGLPTVSMGCGQESVHTVNERLDLPGFRLACRIALRLATGIE